MALAISVPYTIMEDQGITESNPTDGAQAKVKFKCLWTDRIQLVKDLMWGLQNSTKVVGPPGTGKVGIFFRYQPLPYPESPNLYCRAIESIEPLGSPKILSYISPQWLVKQYAVVTAVFSYITWMNQNDASGQPYTQTSINISGEMLRIPGYKFTAGGNPTDQDVGIIVPQMELSFKRYFMPYIPIAEVASVTGMVNASTFNIGDCSFPQDTVLFLGASSEIQSDTQGNITQTVEYHFMFRNNPTWNQLITGGSTNLSYGILAPLAYQRADFSILP